MLLYACVKVCVPMYELQRMSYSDALISLNIVCLNFWLSLPVAFLRKTDKHITKHAYRQHTIEFHSMEIVNIFRVSVYCCCYFSTNPNVFFLSEKIKWIEMEKVKTGMQISQFIRKMLAFPRINDSKQCSSNYICSFWCIYVN